MEKMSSATLLYVLIPLWMCAVLCQGTLAPSEEGSSVTLSCSHSDAIDIRFVKKTDNEFVNISTCSFVQDTCRNFTNQSYSSRISNTQGGYPKMTLSFSNATINDTFFMCIMNTRSGPYVQNFSVEIFARPTKPICDPPSLVNSDTQIITCRTEKVYPSAELDAIMYQTDFTDGPKPDIKCSTSPSPTVPGYKATNCTARFPLSGLKAGTYKFYLAMYLNVSDDFIVTWRTKVESDPIDPVTLTLPTSDPVLAVPGNEAGSKLANVTLGEQTKVTCEVKGGYPQVSQVTIICGSRSEKAKGNNASLALKVTKEVDGLVCNCSAHHVTGSYDRKSEVKLQVKAESGNNSDQTTSIIIGLSVTAVAAVIVVIVIAFIFFYKRRTNENPGVTEDSQPSLPVISHHVPQLNPDNSSDGYITAIDPYDFIPDDGTIPTDSAGYCRPVVRVSDDYVSLQ